MSRNHKNCLLCHPNDGAGRHICQARRLVKRGLRSANIPASRRAEIFALVAAGCPDYAEGE